VVLFLSRMARISGIMLPYIDTGFIIGEREPALFSLASLLVQLEREVFYGLTHSQSEQIIGKYSFLWSSLLKMVLESLRDTA
jgi:hypothetical protein